ncbi:MazG-like family protein, partial [Streptomyces sp. NPDC059853]|uniref:MazG-like family protein n=1 Tax=Streptomyces sp. NPDC059853 TaxID=3346973 RepID=UPI00366732BE
VVPYGSPVDEDAWAEVGRLTAWLDERDGQPPDVRRLLRVLKIAEEAGEVAQAVNGALGANPRKGFSHDWADVHAELCDVIITCMVALSSFTPDARQVFEEHLRRVAARSLPPAAAG